MTATGKILRRKAGQSHNLEHKTPKVKRAFRKDHPLAKADVKMVKKLLGKAASK